MDLVLQQGSSQAADQMLVAVRDQGWPKHGTEKDGGQAGIEESLALQMRYVDGVVQHRLDVDPTSLMKKRKYAKVSRSRFSAAESASRHDEQKQKRKIQVMTDAKIVDIRKPIGADNRKALAKKSGFLEKRVAMESQELLAILFGLFSKQSRWTFGQLQKETLQPTQHLKSVLGQIARLNKVVRGSALAECHCDLSQSNAVERSRLQSIWLSPPSRILTQAHQPILTGTLQGDVGAHKGEHGTRIKHVKRVESNHVCEIIERIPRWVSLCLFRAQVAAADLVRVGPTLPKKQTDHHDGERVKSQFFSVFIYPNRTSEGFLRHNDRVKVLLRGTQGRLVRVRQGARRHIKGGADGPNKLDRST